MVGYRMIGACLVLLSLLGCQQRHQEETSWNPVLEPTDFIYLDDTLARGLEQIELTQEHIHAGDRDATRQNLLACRRSLLELRHYFVPLTQVRQLVYDAGRLYALHRVDAARANLLQAGKVMAEVGNSADGPLQKTTGEVEIMIDRLLLALDQSPGDVPELLESLGHKINMLALKGDLVLAGVRFAEEQ